jgi:hypothetical protein
VTDHRPPPGPLPAPLRPLAGPLSALYRAGLEHKSGAFDAGHGVITIDRPVISVGNLSVGGTGKTPMTSWIVRTLIDAGHTPAIAMRGYRSKNGVSDEADAYARALPGTPVVAQPDRLEGLFRLFADDEGRAVDVVVLDDGFQHRRIARQLDLVLIDATRDPFRDRLLPAGWLREGPAALVRASGVVLTHADRAQHVRARLVETLHRPGRGRFHARPAPLRRRRAAQRRRPVPGARCPPAREPRGRGRECLPRPRRDGGRVFAVGVTGDDTEGGSCGTSSSAGRWTPSRARHRPDPPDDGEAEPGGTRAGAPPPEDVPGGLREPDELGDAAVDAVIDAVRARIAAVDVVCIEDYKKGVCGERLCQAVIERWPKSRASRSSSTPR